MKAFVLSFPGSTEVACFCCRFDLLGLKFYDKTTFLDCIKVIKVLKRSEDQLLVFTIKMAANNVQEKILLQATKIIESQVDAEIAKLDNMEEDDFEALRKRRMEALKHQQQQKQEWRNQGHGEYTEITTEKEFFEQSKKSKNLICHFYRDSTFRCKIVDKHLAELAPKHIEAKFLRINAEKCPFLVERLRIKVIPTICIAKDGKTTDYIVGFDDLGGRDDFPVEMMEWRLAHAEVINYSGDLLTPPWDPSAQGSKKIIGYATKSNKTIRGGGDDDSDNDDDW